MFDKIVTNVLNYYLDAFIENIDYNQIGSSLLTGQLELKNMKLKTTLFNDSPLPFLLQSGQVGRIFFKIPFWDMFASPLIIDISDVFGLVKMKPKQAWSQEKQTEQFQAQVQYHLEQFELFVQQQLEFQREKEKQKGDVDPSTSGSSYVNQIIARIIDNIQIKIGKIYFRFEDQIKHKKQNHQEWFSIGILLREFRIYTTDSNYHQIELKADQPHECVEEKKQSDITHKVLSISGFSIFCDWEKVNSVIEHINRQKPIPVEGQIDSDPLFKQQNDEWLKTEQKLFQDFLDEEFENEGAMSRHKFLLADFGVTVQVAFNKNVQFPKRPITVTDAPHLKANIIIGQQTVPISGNGSEYRVPNSIRKVKSSLLASQVSERNMAPREDAESVLQLNLYQPQIKLVMKTLELISNFNQFKEGVLIELEKAHLEDEEIKAYENDYRHWMIKRNINPNSREVANIKKRMMVLEKKTTDQRIIDIRKRIINEENVKQTHFKRRNEIEMKIRKEVNEKVWFRGLFSSPAYYDDVEHQVREKYQSELDELELNQIDVNINYDYQNQPENDAMVYKKMPAEYVQYHFNIDLPMLRISIENEFNQKLMEFKIIQMHLGYKQAKQFFQSEITLMNIQVEDFWSNGIETMLINSNKLQADNKEALPALNINYEANEEFKKCGFKLKINIHQQLTIVLIIPLINELQRTMNNAFSGEDYDFSYVIDKVTKNVDAMRENVKEYAESIKKGAYSHNNADVDIMIKAPVLKIFQDIFDNQAPYILLDTGQCDCQSELLTFNKQIDAYKHERNPKNLYDRYFIGIKNMKLLFVIPGQETIKLIDDIQLMITIGNCMVPLHKELPTIIVKLELDTIKFNLTLHNLQQILVLKDKLMIQLAQTNFLNLETRLHQQFEIPSRNSSKLNRQRSSTQSMRKYGSHKRHDSLQLRYKPLSVISNDNTNDPNFISPRQFERDRLKVQLEKDRQKLNQRELKLKSIDKFYEQEGTTMELVFSMQMLQLALADNGSNQQVIQLRNLRLKYKNEVNQRQDKVVFSVDSFIFKREKDVRYQKNNLGQINSSVIQHPDEISILNRIMSSPFLDKDEVNNDILLIPDLHLLPNFTDEKDLYVEYHREQTMSFDEDFDESVKTSQEVLFGVINRSRIVLNFLYVKDALLCYDNLMKTLSKGPEQYSKILTSEKSEIFDFVNEQVRAQQLNESEYSTSPQFQQIQSKSFGEAYTQAKEKSAKHDLVIKIISNYGKQIVCSNYDEAKFFENCLNILAENEEMLKSRKFKKTQSRNSVRPSNRSVFVKEQEGFKIAQKRKTHMPSLRAPLGNIKEFNITQEQSGTSESELESSSKSQSIRVSRTKIQQFRKQLLGIQIEEEEENKNSSQDSSMSNHSKRLYFLKETYSKRVMEIKIKMKNMAIWVQHFEGNLSHRAQILQLHFGGELYKETESFTKEIECIKRPLKELMEEQNIQDVSKLVISHEIVEKIYRTLEYDDRFQMNLNNLSIKQMLVEDWSSLKYINLIQSVEEFKSTQQKLTTCEEDQHEIEFDKEEGSLQHSDDFKSFQQPSDLNDIQYAVSLILKPTSISLLKTCQTQYKQLCNSDLVIQSDPLLLQVDFKDIDLMYNLYLLYFEMIQPIISNLGVVEEDKQDISNSLEKDKEEEVGLSFQEDSPQPKEQVETQSEIPEAEEEFFTISDFEEKFYSVGQEYTRDTDKFQHEIYNQNIRIGQIMLSLKDGEIENFIGNFLTDPVPLVETVFNNFVYQCKTDIVRVQSQDMLRALPIESYFLNLKRPKQDSVYYNMVISLGIYGTFFNDSKQSFEPFIEPWSLTFGIKQPKLNDVQEMSIVSEQMFNLNFTFGVAQQVKKVRQRIFDKTLKTSFGDHHKAHDYDIVKDSSTAQIQKEESPLGQRPFQTQQSFSMTKGHRGSNDNQSDANGIQICNYLGLKLMFCMSHPKLDDELEFKSDRDPADQSWQAGKQVKDRVGTIQGSLRNSHNERIQIRLPDEYLEKQRQIIKIWEQNQYSVGGQSFENFIEDSPNLMDFKIDGLCKLQALQIDNCGVYSYAASIQSETAVKEINKREAEKSQIGVLVNINSNGKQKIINLESQLLIQNNMDTNITLVFKVKSLNQHVAPLSIVGKQHIKQFNKKQFIKSATMEFKNNGFVHQESKQRSITTKRVKFKAMSPSIMSEDESQEIKVPIMELQSNPSYREKIKPKDNKIDKKVVKDQSVLINTGDSMSDEIIDETHFPFQTPTGQFEIEVTINSRDNFKVPLAFLLPDSDVDILIKPLPDNQEVFEAEKVLLFEDIKQVFQLNQQKLLLNKKHHAIKSQIVELHQDLYVSVDIQGYTCMPKVSQDQNPLQYVVSLNPPLILANYSMMPLVLTEIDYDEFGESGRKEHSRIAASRTDNIVQLNLNHSNQSKFLLQFIDVDSGMRLTKIVSNFDKSTIEDGLMFHRHINDDLVTFEYLEEIKDLVHMQVERAPVVFQDSKVYQEDFSKRQKLLDIATSSKLTIYPPFLIVNKTDRNIQIKGQIIEAKTNQLLFSKTKARIKLEVHEPDDQHGFFISKNIDIMTIGVIGEANLRHTNKECVDQLQFGISIAQGAFPYNNTIIVTIVPRFMIVNKLNFDLIVKQHMRLSSSRKQDPRTEKEVLVPCNQRQCMIEMHFKRCPNARKATKQITVASHYRNANSANFESYNQIDSTGVKKEDDRWCVPFSVNEMQDFFTEFKVDEPDLSVHSQIPRQVHKEPSGFLAKRQAKNWFQPNQENNFQQVSRVMITANPSDGGATILIIFQEPFVPQFQIKNLTKKIFEYRKYDHKAKAPLSEFRSINEGETHTFTWDNTEVTQKNLQMRFSETEKLVQLDRLTEKQKNLTKSNLLFEEDNTLIFYRLHFDENNGQTKVLTILSHSQNDVSKKTLKSRLQRGKLLDHVQEGKCETQRSAEASSDEEEAEQKVVGQKIMINLQGIGISLIDGEPDELLYICLSKILLNYQYKTVQLKDQVETDTKTIIELNLGNFQIDNLTNEDYPVLLGTRSFYHKRLTQANISNAMSNLSTFYKIVQESEIKSKKSKPLDNMPFIVFEIDKNSKAHQEKIGSLVRYEKLRFCMQKFFLQVESTIIGKILQMLTQIQNVFSSEENQDIMTTPSAYIMSLNKRRHQECPAADAEKGVVFDAQNLAADKVSFGYLQIATIEISITFKLELEQFNFDFTDPRQLLFGLMNLVKPFISQLASITDAKIKFNEIIIYEGFQSQEQMVQNILNQYINRGIVQIYKILGSSNIIGNPVGFANKAGAAFYELVREPIMGLQQSPEAFLQGMTTGMQGVVSGVIGGGFENLGIMTGSMYTVIKRTTGNEDVRRDKAENIAQGLYYALKGLGIEVFTGVKGLVYKPIQGAQREGLIGFTKGIGQGLAGAATTPLTGVLRAGQSMSEGISGTANWVGNYGKTKFEQLDVFKVRVRPIRRIDVRGQIKIYDEDLAIVNKLLLINSSDAFRKQQIRFYCIMPLINPQGEVLQNKKNMMVITNEYMILLRVYNFLDLQQEKYQHRSVLMCEKLSNIVSYNILKKPLEYKKDPDHSNKVMAVPPMYFMVFMFNKTAPKQKAENYYKEKGPFLPYSSMKLVQVQKNKSTPVKEQMAPLPNEVLSIQSAIKQRAATMENEREASEQKQRPRTIRREDSFFDEKENVGRYKYVFFSPKVELFYRIDQLLLTLPEVQSNIRQFQKEKMQRELMKRIMEQKKLLKQK